MKSHRLSPRRACLALAALTLGYSPLQGAEPKTQAPTTQSVDDAIAHLGDSDPAVRDAAMKSLREAGADARAALKAAAEGDDPETAARARELLRGVGAVPESKASDTDETAPMIFRYRTTDPQGRPQVVIELASSPNGLRALTRIWTSETDAALRETIFEQLLTDLPGATASLLADGNDATAERLLESAVDRHTPDSPRQYAAYWFTRGKLDEAIRRWASRGGNTPADTWAEQVLCRLLRAKGDAQAAITHARAADDGTLLQETLLWSGDWPALGVAVRANAPVAQEPTDLSLMLAADYLGGDEKALSADIAQMLAVAHGQAGVVVASNLLLLVDRPEEAVKVLVDAKEYGAAYLIDSERGREDTAAALLADHDADVTASGMSLRAAAAKSFARLGLKNECGNMIDRVIKESAATRTPLMLVALAETERDAGRTDPAWQHFREAIQSAGDEGTQWYVSRAFPADPADIDWVGIWTSAVSHNPGRKAADLFDRVRTAYDGSMPLEALVKAVSSIDLSNEIDHAYVGLIRECARRLRAAGRKPEAVKLLEQCGQGAGGGELYEYLGDWSVEEGDWSAAAARYEASWKKDRSRALPLHLMGWALTQSDRAADGREKMALAHSLPLGDEARRAELMRGLSQRGLDDAATREADVLIRTGDSLTAPSQEAMRLAATNADDREDFAVGAALWQRDLLTYLVGSYIYNSPEQYLHQPQAIRSSRARALIKAGDLDGAQRQIDQSLRLLPIDSEIVIDVFPVLEKMGKQAEADALYQKMSAIQEGLCEKFPDSWYHLNECAWLEAKCGRNRDKAIAHAQRGIELRQGSAAADIIDTLAEAYFVNGQADKAIVEEKKCIELNRTSLYHRRQLARFVHGQAKQEK